MLYIYFISLSSYKCSVLYLNSQAGVCITRISNVSYFIYIFLWHEIKAALKKVPANDEQKKRNLEKGFIYKYCIVKFLLT